MLKKFLFLIIIAFIGVQQLQSQVIIGLLFGEKLNKGPIEFGLGSKDMDDEQGSNQ